MDLLARTVLISCVFLLAAPAFAKGGDVSAERIATLEEQVAQLQLELSQRPKDVSAYELPNQLNFCGEKVDMSRPDVRERMEKEFYLVLGDRAQVVLWWKRAQRVFPIVERELSKLSMCSDLKFTAVVESGLRGHVKSRAKAQGWWQFMRATGKSRGLKVSRAWDDRGDLGHSTRAAAGYLADLNRRFGQWASALAAYNTGPTRLAKARTVQGFQDYWDLHLYSEAERYVPRIFVVKEILENPEKYGFAFQAGEGWDQGKRGYVRVAIPSDVELDARTALKASGVSYRTLRRLNPELSGPKLPSGMSIVLEVPMGTEKAVRRGIQSHIDDEKERIAQKRKRALARKKKKSSRTRRVKVRTGDSLWTIAKAQKVSVRDLRRWNKLKAKSVIKPGQTLLVRSRG